MAVERGERRGGSGIGCFSCCFGGGEDGDGEELGQRAARALRTSSRWVRDRAVELPEMVARAGRRRRRKPHQQQHHHQQQQQLPGEFRYDPVSYALNFEDDGDGEAEPFKYMAFSARLPASPPATALPVDGGS